MRILAIRGENLASLRQFDLDLDDADGLGAAGLFAITGPTGAGKSTLLDALCLALYDKTPRFDSSRSGHRVGRDPDDPTNLGAMDVRNILRRGAGAGFAEVDFVGRDGGHYRARWLVHRARNRPGNRMQSQTMQLTDLLDGQPLGGATKSETLAHIEDLTGLSFDQFRRSVLLAQGDFDAFLRAQVKERGALLERMTGTDIYRRLSVAAHERHRDARAVVQRLDDQLAAHPALPDGRRASLAAMVADSDAWVAAGRAREAAAEDAVRWFERDAVLDASASAARATLASARVRDEQAADARLRLARVQQVQPIKPLVEAAARAEGEATRRAAQLAASRAAARSARASADTARVALAAAQAGHAAARAAEQAAAPDVQAARALDVRVDAAATACDEAAEGVDEAKAAHQAQVAAIGQLQQTRAAAEAAATTAPSAESEGLIALIPRWPEVAAGVDRWRAARAAVAASASEVAAAVAEAQARADVLSDAQARRDTARAALAQADAAAQAAEQALRRVDGADARDLRQRHADTARHLEQLRDVAEQARRLTAARADSDVRVKAAQARRTPLRGALTKAERREAEARERLDLARKALRLSRAVSAAADHRAHLVPGEPCPVCGATEHPGVDPALSATSQFQAQVDALEAEVEAAGDQAEQARVDLSAIAATLDAEAHSRDRLLADQGALLDSWSMMRMQVGEVVPARPDADGAVATVKAQLELARQARDAATTRLDAAKARLAERDAASEARQAAQAALTAAQARADQAHTQLLAAQAVVADKRAAHAEATAATSQADGRISALIDHVGREMFEADPAAALAAIDAQIAAHQAAQRARADARELLSRTETQWARLHADADACRAQLERQAARFATLDARLRALRTQRAGLLGGQAADAVADQLAAERRAAEARLDAARAAQESADHAATRSAEATRAAGDAATEAQAAHDAARDRLAKTCAAADLAVDAVAEWTQHDAAWIAAEADRLGALTAAVARAEAVHRERAADLQAHRARPVAAPDLEVARALYQQAEAQRRALERAQTTAEARLVRDDAARAARATAEAARRDAEADRQLWGQLDMLIGSADGAAFREFAQSLTLDAVIARANHHLATLARRYALMRVPGENLELQVIDLHMGEEVRTVKSLSGGETFLVSLALALGLASLSARDTRIESLFIDEGFGTLDTDTLDVVLDALDALQAGGRQIGLISHVPGLAQRIGVQVLVEPTASGLSAVTVSAGWRG